MNRSTNQKQDYYTQIKKLLKDGNTRGLEELIKNEKIDLKTIVDDNGQNFLFFAASMQNHEK
jgi:hypothetical protein